MDEEKLINLVRAYKELYDLNDPHYDVRPKRDLAWQQIGEALKQSPGKMDEEKLINLVRAYKELYDLNDPHYDVRPKRDLAWQQIGEALKQSPRDCREKWKRIRDCYRRAQKLRRVKTERGGKIIKRPKYEKILKFLNPHLKDDIDGSSLNKECGSSDVITERCQPAASPDLSYDEGPMVEQVHSPCSSRDSFQHHLHQPQQRQYVEPAAAEQSPALATYPAPSEMTYSQMPQRDKTKDFFMGLVETVKDFPEEVQIRVKREIFKLVSEAEELVYKNKTENQLVVMGIVKEE